MTIHVHPAPPDGAVLTLTDEHTFLYTPTPTDPTQTPTRITTITTQRRRRQTGSIPSDYTEVTLQGTTLAGYGGEFIDLTGALSSASATRLIQTTAHPETAAALRHLMTDDNDPDPTDNPHRDLLKALADSITRHRESTGNPERKRDYGPRRDEVAHAPQVTDLATYRKDRHTR